MVAVPVLVIGSARASEHFRWWHAVALAGGLTVFSVLVFVKALGVPLPVLGSWFGS
jgi:putative tricarboxylic transport membrane protein